MALRRADLGLVAEEEDDDEEDDEWAVEQAPSTAEPPSPQPPRRMMVTPTLLDDVLLLPFAPPLSSQHAHRGPGDDESLFERNGEYGGSHPRSGGWSARAKRLVHLFCPHFRNPRPLTKPRFR